MHISDTYMEKST